MITILHDITSKRTTLHHTNTQDISISLESVQISSVTSPSTFSRGQYCNQQLKLNLKHFFAGFYAKIFCDVDCVFCSTAYMLDCNKLGCSDRSHIDASRKGSGARKCKQVGTRQHESIASVGDKE